MLPLCLTVLIRSFTVAQRGSILFIVQVSSVIFTIKINEEDKEKMPRPNYVNTSSIKILFFVWKAVEKSVENVQKPSDSRGRELQSNRNILQNLCNRSII